jgi:peptide/nickel transport system permease protein
VVPLALAVAGVFGSSVPTTILVIGVTQWMYMARAVYGMVQSLREWEFVTAARAVGVGDRRILARHIAPHLLPVLITYATLGIPGSILLESTLSFLNAGVPPPTASWGSMIADAQTYYRLDPALMLYPGLLLVVVVLAFTLLGDGLSRALEAR